MTSTDCSKTCSASGVIVRTPLRISSSSVSTEWVNSDISMKPNVPAPPLMECAARNMVFIVSRSAPSSRVKSPASMALRPSRLSSKKSLRISSISRSIDMELEHLCYGDEKLLGIEGFHQPAGGAGLFTLHFFVRAGFGRENEH